MNGATVAILVVLGAAAPGHTPDLQVEAVTATGAELPELAEAVARALVAAGAQVVMRGPTSSPCEYCGRVRVTETGSGSCRVEIRQDLHTASTILHLPAGSSLLDRARAIAIQARLLMSWQVIPESRPREAAARFARKGEARASGEVTRARPVVSAPVPSPILDAASVQPVAPTPVASQPPVRPVEAPAVYYASRSESQSTDRPAEVRSDIKPSMPPANDGPVPSVVAHVEAKTETASEGPAAQPSVSKGRLVVADLAAKRTFGLKRQWPWIPTAMGSGAAAAAGICALISRGHYNALSDRAQTYDSAVSHKAAGESWQTAALVLSGVAVVGLGTGLIGFATRPPAGPTVSAVASPMPGGGMIAIAGNFQ